MSLASWLADGADPTRMNPEEVRRLQGVLGVREEQAIARLEALVGEQADLVARGAATPSAALRRALARRHARLAEDVEDTDRELARLGKELAGLRTLRDLLRDGVPLAAPGDCAPLLALLDDTSAGEDAFADQLGAALRAGQAQRRTAATREAPDLMALWERMDRGEPVAPQDLVRPREPRAAGPGAA